jgi:hypothetical protein
LAATRLTPDVVGRGATLFGRVRTVHRAALYVDLGSSNLLVVAIDDVGGVPGGILVRDVVDLTQAAIERGMAFLPSGGGWSIPSAGIAIDASQAIAWSPALPTAARLSSVPKLAQTMATARGLAAERAPAGGLAPLLAGGGRPGDPWLGVARTLISMQLDALRRRDDTAAHGATVELIGLGVGLTPSGDDYLVGLLAGLEATDDPARHGLAASIARHAPGRTTAFGAAALAHAARGAYAERLHGLLVALADGRLDGLMTSIERALAYGATSGADTLVGLFSGLDVALSRPARNATVAA